MNAHDLRPCPFCANDKPVVIEACREWGATIALMCPECGALGPLALSDDPPGHAVFLWNQRFGMNH
jgi:uncharacterized Zn finger protein